MEEPLKYPTPPISLGKSLATPGVFPLIFSLLYCLSIAALQPGFFHPSNLLSVLYYTSLLVPAVIGVYLLTLLGLFDLSVGAVAAISGVICAKALLSGWSITTSVLLAVIAGGAAGFLNAILVTGASLSPLIATIITMGAARALALGLSDGRILGGLPPSYARILMGGNMIQLRLVIAAILFLALIEILARRHVLFRYFYHAGSSRSAVASCGISVKALECTAFVLAGVGAAVVGVFQSARTLSASPLAFPELALEAIAACIIGGMSLTGGAGTVSGAAIGMLIVVSSRNIVGLLGVNVYWKDLAISTVLLASVLINSRRHQTV